MGTKERASPPDIVPETSIEVMCFNEVCQVIIDYKHLNIPFTKHAKILPLMSIPNSNSMDRYMDEGHNYLCLEPTNKENHKIMLDWLEEQFYNTDGMLAADCVYRMMVKSDDAPTDFSKSSLFYAIHRIRKIGQDKEGRYWRFGGINNLGFLGMLTLDPFIVRDRNILYLNTGVIH